MLLNMLCIQFSVVANIRPLSCRTEESKIRTEKEMTQGRSVSQQPLTARAAGG